MFRPFSAVRLDNMKEALSNLFQRVVEMRNADLAEWEAKQCYMQDKRIGTMMLWHSAGKRAEQAEKNYRAAAAICDGLAE